MEMPTQKPQGGRPPGNGERWWRAAIERAVKKLARGEKQIPLDRIADRLVKEAMAGDIMAMKEIGDRLDGKSVQPNTHEGNPENPVRIVVETGIARAAS